MANYTPNLNLRKPLTTEKYDVVADLNDTKDKIDTHAGAVDAQLADISINVKNFGAVGDGVTDDTQAFQNALDSLDNDGVLYIPKGLYIIRQLVISSGVMIRGAGAGITYVRQKSGETVSLVVDNGNPINIFIRDISFEGNNNTTEAVIKLGYNGVQVGVFSGFHDVFVRHNNGNGIMINGNVCTYRNVEVYGCAGKGFVLSGSGNKASNLIFSSCDEVGLYLDGSLNTVRDIHVESSTITACVEVKSTAVGNIIDGALFSVIGTNSHGAGVKIGANCYNTQIKNIIASAPNKDKFLNGLIYDLTVGTRKTWGAQYANLYWAITDYISGYGLKLDYKINTPPIDGTHNAGDYFNTSNGAPGIPSGFVCVQGGTPGKWAPTGVNVGAVTKTSDYTVLDSDNGKRFSNEGASAPVTFFLPVSDLGQRLHFTRRNGAHALIIEPNGSNYIWPAPAGKYISLDTDGASVTIERIANNQWAITAQSGTVTAQP